MITNSSQKYKLAKPTPNTNRLKIFLADLVHSANGTYGLACMPLGIGLIASYAKMKFGNDIEIRLFKYPENLLQALEEEHCDILGCSTYVWNCNLSLWACKVAKKKNRKILTCIGGPDFPFLATQKLHYLQRHNYVDIGVLYEGEIGFANIVELMLEKRDSKNIFFETIDGCVFLHPHEKKLVEGNAKRVGKLDSIPSPYTIGLLDKFFDGNFKPIIQTTRGCPFTCNYCVESASYYSKIRQVQAQYASEELFYICERISNTAIHGLLITDSNFGMYRKDKAISETIRQLQDKYNWPLEIAGSTGKNIDKVIENIKGLRESFHFSMSVQSMDKTVLEEIGRKNIPPETYKAAADILVTKRQPILAETIMPLPKETFESYLNGVMDLINLGAKRIVMNTLMVLNGTIYKDEKYRERYSYETKFRVLPFGFGVYEGEKIFEYEEVGVATNSLSFEKYLKVREVCFLLEILFNSSIFIEASFFIKDHGLHYKDFVMVVLRELENADGKIQRIFQSFVDEIQNELKEDEKSLVEFYSKNPNYKKLVNGEIGGNLVFNHKVLLFKYSLPEWIEFVFNCLEKFIATEKKIDVKYEIEDLANFATCKFGGILDASKTDVDIKGSFHHDIKKWLGQETHTLPLTEFKTNKTISYRFYYSRDQSKIRNHLFKEYCEESISDLIKVLALIRPQERLFREFELIDEKPTG